ncbi:DNA-processing protein DprA [Antrihabitans spumae]|uniref:DNA-processing protein DprA n=1 Tax=Antrihabitans spumae TaxID=3373370 RepID=A0ABW7KBJ3_9NOCA
MAQLDDEDERAILLALLEARPSRMTWPQIASEVTLRGSASALWDEAFPPMLDGVNDAEGLIAQSRTRLAEWAESDFELLTVLDPDYPLALREIHQIPPFLFIRGKLNCEELAVSVVGSRDASARGVDIAGRIAQGLVERGISVLSGLAAGIDTAAHTAALKVGGRPIGVIGTGIKGVYPAANRSLHLDVAKAGALISQFWPDAPPRKQNFPMRNATMSGLGRVSIVVEAGENSGARIQARVAVEHGRPVILTDLVVAATDWAKALIGRPGVYQAGGIVEAMDIVDQVTSASSDDFSWPSLTDLASR